MAGTSISSNPILQNGKKNPLKKPITFTTVKGDWLMANRIDFATIALLLLKPKASSLQK